jgi:diguanylate cyclase (GGDEF)-like protein
MNNIIHRWKRKVHNSEIKKADHYSNVVYFLSIILFIIMAVLQMREEEVRFNWHGIIAQMQVLISVLLVLICRRRGYIAAVLMNFIQSMAAAVDVILKNDLQAVPGIVIPINTIIIIYIILHYKKRNQMIRKEEFEVREHYTELCEELVDTQKKLYYDELTKLPNRKKITAEVHSMCKQHGDDNRQFYIVFLDLDNFKDVNDFMGHYAGDKLLVKVGQCLARNLYQEDMAGRLAGDEFIILIRRKMNANELMEYLKQIRNQLLSVFKENSSGYNTSASFGVSIFPKDGCSSKELIKSADLAMYQAKNQGKNQICYFDPSMKENFRSKGKKK